MKTDEPSSGGILVINPGGTSTKVALFDRERELFSLDVRHDPARLAAWGRVIEQLEFRLGTVRELLAERRVAIAGLAAVAGRGGALAPVPSGTFLVDEAMLGAIRKGRVMVEHPSLLGAPMADRLAREAGCPAFVVDPVCVDELLPEAKLSGLPSLPRRALSHALSVKAAAREVAARMGRSLEELDLIVLHLGSGFTVAAQRQGRQIDHNDATACGPMAPTRAGDLPSMDLARLCCSGALTFDRIERMLVGEGGWRAHLGTDDVREVYRRVDAGEAGARLVLDATLHQLAKEVGGLLAVLSGRVDAIVVTGGVARSERFVGELQSRLSWIGAPLHVLPGEHEMRALARGARRVLDGEIEAVSMAPFLEAAGTEGA
ncbi:MAG TPA: butyrate kinase [Polyangia bacterium]|nr:butyrate kinase [Polyangia bacterium]